MLRNKNIVRSDIEVMVPAKLNFGDTILKKLVQFKDNIYLINGSTGEQITYGEILQQTMNAAISLAHIGVRKGQTVGILSANRNEFFPAVLGVICSGATLTTFNVGYTAGELTHVLKISKPTAIFCSPEAYKSNYKTLKSSGFIKTFIIFGDKKFDNTIPYNSIAFPKNVINTVNEIFNVKSNELLRDINIDEFEVPDVEGQNDTMLILYSSGTTGLPKGAMITHLNALTAFFQPSSHDPSLLTLTITPWYHVMGLVGNLIAITYGRTAVYLPKFEPQLYLRTIEQYKVADLRTGEALGPYTQGEICVKGPLVMKGYVGKGPEEWRDKEGYLRTGDIGYYDEDGCFFVVDRLKELIKYKGYQVPPAEIEAVLLTHPAVNDAGVVGIEHPEAGEIPMAFVVKRPGSDATEEDIKAFVAERLSNPKHLRGGVRFVDHIPKTASGKILRKTLKLMLQTRKSKL